MAAYVEPLRARPRRDRQGDTMPPKLLFLCLISHSAFAVPSEEEQNRTFDPSPNCQQARKAFQGNFKKLLSKNPECKVESLFLNFKKREVLRTKRSEQRGFLSMSLPTVPKPSARR